MIHSKIYYLLVFLLCCLPLPASAWHIRLIVADTQARLLDDGNALGQLPDSMQGYDLHDLVEFPPFGPPYLTLVFPHKDWGVKAGDYATDFHAPTPNTTDTWAFEVRTDVPNRKITLSWDSDDAARLQHSRLLDNSTGKTTVIRANQSYSFTMTGQTTRSFTWKVLP